MKQKLFAFIFILYIIPAFSQMKITVVVDSIFSKSINAYSRFNVILPDHYNQSEERYTTLYLLHGYTGGQDDWVSRTGLVKYLKEHNLIVVTPDGKNSWYTNSPTEKNKNFEDLIIKELIPYIDKTYRTLSTRHGRTITGLSMGGYGAIKLALKYPGYFFFSASLSGALQFPGVIEEMQKSNYNKGIGQSIKEAFGEDKSVHWTKNDPFMLVDSIANLSMPYLYISI